MKSTPIFSACVDEGTAAHRVTQSMMLVQRNEGWRMKVLPREQNGPSLIISFLTVGQKQVFFSVLTDVNIADWLGSCGAS
ncbi:MAG: hypothetical protein NZ899_02035 [Thermoguttaceae bacterium]|nr:hypothetical protein [Thermoguttaceae bacterium]